jgi:hypothetical protein
MKTSFVSKISAVIIFAAAAGAFAPSASTFGGEVIIKRGGSDIKHPAKVVAVTPKAEATPSACTRACKPEFVATKTSDSKLATKTLFVEQHACKSCTTSITRVGAQKATGKDLAQHSCAGRLISMNTCCSSTPAP